ncbi:hypothetical protein PISMIDRAFT_322998 [Pisolithus microcarpus 441]|uniref:Uncharacterized protein n=1 Tax=Pisolithus microcarpus 441 TaxID=765257 RepID=A0A0C9Z602_9AGAM|nr:hypothetical protein PISMIDRAFT_322998 [Pisolithus microcarpus 441]
MHKSELRRARSTRACRRLRVLPLLKGQVRRICTVFSAKIQPLLQGYTATSEVSFLGYGVPLDIRRVGTQQIRQVRISVVPVTINRRMAE